MKTTFTRSLVGLLAVALFAVEGCAASTHPHVAASAGSPSRTHALESVVDQKGPLTVETVTSIKWAVPLEGLVNLDHPKAKAAGLKSGEEPIDVYFHVIRHPTKGTYLVDTGVERALRDDPDKAAIRGLVASFLHREKMTFLAPLGDWLASHPEPIRGVFLTHAHLDHVAGLPDVPKDVPVYTGPGELDEHSFMNLFVRGNTDRALEGFAPSGEWRFSPIPMGRSRASPMSSATNRSSRYGCPVTPRGARRISRERRTARFCSSATHVTRPGAGRMASSRATSRPIARRASRASRASASSPPPTPPWTCAWVTKRSRTNEKRRARPRSNEAARIRSAHRAS
ncbi:Beta-lactamase-like [Labilithrix luteola]|uniref:Beta-lactamase-like n=1 Tax=Labilithrix luteola TaxID=1391654 RepID=A0A0K1PVW5_9BACT|nr:MBL fold metallo-hydrolase [Labilithrix luteola]AKU97531.1 Beta-lactamase-like [Labilithrix luteola]